MGARLVLDLNPSGSSSPQSMISIDGMLYFTADLGTSGVTPPESESDSDVNSGEEIAQKATSPSVNQLGSGLALLKSDGTSDGTKLLKEFQSINDLVEVNGELYFIADDGTGNRLWKSDGTARGTVLVKDLYPGADPNFPQDLFEIDGVLFYSARDTDKYPYVNGYEVWRREGNEIGSRFFRNLIPDKIITDVNVSPEEIETIALDENGNPIELTKTTTVNTQVNLDEWITTITTTVEEETYINGEVVTTTTTSTQQRRTEPNDLKTEERTETYEIYDLVDTDGNLIKQFRLDTIVVTTREVNVNEGKIYTTIRTTQDYVLNGVLETDTWEVTTEEPIQGGDLEGTTFTEEKSFATTIIVTNTAEITTTTYENDSFPRDFVGINGNYFFSAQSSSFYSLETLTSETLIGGLELWFSDGTEAGTRPININQNNYTFYEPEGGEYKPAEITADPNFGFKQQSSSSFPRELTKFKDDLVLVANDGISGFELWAVSDQGDNLRQIADLSEGNTSSSPEELTVVDDRLYFTANTGSGRKLWSLSTDLDKPTLVQGAGNKPKHLSNINGKLYFSAKSELGRELWVANGDSANLAADINPGSGSSSPKEFNVVNHWVNQAIETHLYFSADDGKRGVELWSLNLSDNKADPQRQADILSGPSSSEPLQITNSEERLFFTADDGQSGRELWTLGVLIQGPNINQDDGVTVFEVEENQKKVYQFTSNSSVIWSLNGGVDEDLFKIKKDGNLIFKDAPNFEDPKDIDGDNTYEVVIRATDEKNGTPTDLKVNVIVTNVIEDRPSDGEIGGGDEPATSSFSTTLIKNIHPGSKGSKPANLTSLKDSLLFSANNGKKGTELWHSQGTKKTTILLKDINKGAESSNPTEFAVKQTEVYFSANDGRKGQELWISNGEKAGTELLADINPGDAGSFPTDLLWLNQNLFFAADDGRHGRELWKYSRKDQASSMVLDIQSNSKTGSNPSELTELYGQIVFAANDQIYGRELWISDGTAGRTRLLEDINPGGFSSNPSNLNLLNNKLYFTAESYLLDGTQIMRLEKNASKVTAIVGSIGDATGSDPSNLHASENRLFYSAATKLEPKEEETDTGSGTISEDPGGFMVATSGIEQEAVEYINQYNEGIDEYRRGGDSDFYLDDARFWANQLLTSSLVDKNDSSLAQDWNLYFQSLSSSSPIQIPENSDSNAATRSTISTPGDSNEGDDENNLGRELWISNGKTNGSSLLKDINPGAASSNPSDFATIGLKTYFSADNGIHGEELWMSDGTKEGTMRLTDINKGSKNSSPRDVSEGQDGIYFSAIKDKVGRELWRLDDDNQSATRIVTTGKGKKKLRALDDSSDEFRFELANQFGKGKADQITGFSPDDGDQLALSTNAFQGLSEINLVTVSSNRQLKAQQTQPSNFIYYEAKGQLYFDQNESDKGYGKEGGLFAILKGGPDLTESSFQIV